MSRRFRTSLGRSGLALIAAAALVVSGFRAGTANADPDPPQADRKDRLAALSAEAALMEVECAAARENLLESLKKLGKLRLGDNREAMASFKFGALQLKGQAAMAATTSGQDPQAIFDKVQKSLADEGRAYPKEAYDLLPKLMEEGTESLKAIDALAEFEWKLQVNFAEEEANRMRADFLEKHRSLHRKKQELAEAEVRPGE